jgi:hypothetical protein
MARPRKRPKTLLYVEIGLSDGTRYRIGMRAARPIVEEIRQNFEGFDRVTASCTIEQFLAVLESERQARTLTTEEGKPNDE